MEASIGSFSGLLDNPVSFEVELTSRCNSRCVGCSRFSHFYFANPYYENNRDLPKEILFKALSAAKKLDFILFCGNYGDPLLHPEILDILAQVRQEHGDVKISIHTNASFGNGEFWKRLASYFTVKGSSVKFSLDGLKASHEKFRRGTNWDRALNNAEIFIAAGGRAVWKAIEFEHNQHEIDELQRLALEKGFLNLDRRKNNYPGLDQPIQHEVDLKVIPAAVVDDQIALSTLRAWNREQVLQKGAEFIECNSLVRKNLFIDAHGEVWPCCWIGGLPYRPEHELRLWFKEQIIKKYQAGFNSLAKKDLQEILSHSWFKQDLGKSWLAVPEEQENPLLATCAKTCGKCMEPKNTSARIPVA